MKKFFFIIISVMSFLSVPFEVMADDPSDGTEVDVNVGEWDDEDDQNVSVEFEGTGVASTSVQIKPRVVIENGCVVIYSDIAMTMPVYDLRGGLVCRLSLQEGRNEAANLPKGIIIIAKTKINHL